MCLRFVFLLIMRLAAWLRLSRRKETWKTAEILILRHQLAVLQRRQPRRPKLNWADRALLATLLSVIPKTRRRGLWLLVTPDAILRLAPATSSAAAMPPGVGAELGGSASISEIAETVIKREGFSDAQQAKLHSNGPRPRSSTGSRGPAQCLGGSGCSVTARAGSGP